MVKSIAGVGAEDLVRAGLAPEEAALLEGELKDAVALSRRRLRANAAAGEETAPGEEPRDVWREITARKLLKPWHPHALHQLIYYSIYHDYDESSLQSLGPPLYWFPSLDEAKCANLGRLMETHGPKVLGASYKDPIASFKQFHKFSVDHPEIYWSFVLNELSIRFREAPKCILDTSDKSKPRGSWLPGSVLNIAECCLLPSSYPRKQDNSLAIVWRAEGRDDDDVNCMSLKELREQVMLVANALDSIFSKGDTIAIDMQMTEKAVIIYLAIVLGGFVVVSIADSFAPKEIATRLRVSKAQGIFTQDFIVRGGRRFPLYSRVVEAAPKKVIVVPAAGEDVEIQLRQQDVSWKGFLAGALHLPRPSYCTPVYQPIDSITNILFSSGTTGDPKAIPWTHLSPMRTADSWAHADVQAGDVYCWPTNLGWAMGPTLLYACFLTGATLALYHGSPLGHSFGRFVQDAVISILGTVPSLVKAWKSV